MRQFALFSYSSSRQVVQVGLSNLSLLRRAWALMLTLCVMSAQAILPVQAQTPQAGDFITNQAEASFYIGALPVRISSNQVRVVVSPQEDLLLTSDNNVRYAPGASVTLPHRLMNTGNVPAQYSIQIGNLTGDDFDLTNLRLVRDSNGNGRPDPGEPEIFPSDLIALEPYQSVDLVIVGNVPTDAGPGQSAQVQIIASSDAQGIQASNIDTVSTSLGTSLRVTKAPIRQMAQPGDEVSFTISVQSLGNTAPEGILVTVNNAPQTLVILRDAIPANTTYVSATTPNAATLLYHRIGDALHTYTTIAPPPAEIDAVALGFNPYPNDSVAQLTLRVLVGQQASGDIINQAILFGIDPFTGERITPPSNPALVSVPRVPPTVTYYTGSDFSNIARLTGVGNPLWVQGVAASCNANPTEVERIIITLQSKLTGDRLARTAIETGPNTGIFRIVPEVPTNNGPAVETDDILSVLADDTVTARFSDCGMMGDAVAQILVDPVNVVFDSRTNQPIQGATVTLIDVTGAGNGGNAGGPATVYDYDGVTPRSATVITGADGRFEFPLVPPSTYRIVVLPPTGYEFPSDVSPLFMPPTRTIDSAGSYGNNFALGGPLAPIAFDVPLDGPPPSGLFIEKSASRQSVEIADFLEYKIVVRNQTGLPLSNSVVTDRLPQGFVYVEGSTRIGGTKAADPVGGKGPELTFALGQLDPNEENTIIYRVKIGAAVKIGKNTNRAQARGVTVFGTTLSNIGAAQVTVNGGVFTTRGIIFGKVFVDKNRNKIQDIGEDGIPGVRVLMEDGTFAITDREGKYSIYGLQPITHTVKVDKTTLPQGAKLHPLSNRHGLVGDSSWADLKNAEMLKVNFADSIASEEVLAEVARRRATALESDEVNDGVRTQLQPEANNNSSRDPRSLPSSGTVTPSGVAPLGDRSGRPGLPTNASENAGYTPVGNPGASRQGGTVNHPLSANIGAPGMNETATAGNLKTSNLEKPLAGQVPSTVEKPLDGLPTEPVQATPQTTADAFATLLPTLDNELGFIDLKDGATLPTDQTNVRVKGMMGAQFKLFVNGAEFPSTRVGTRSVLESKQIQAWEYIGVRLKGGENTLEIAQSDGFGNEKARKKVTIMAPGTLGRLRLTLPAKSAAADGRTPLTFVVELTDDKGTPVTSRTPVTIEASRGKWLTRDINSIEPGLQIFVEGGRTEVQLLSPIEPGECLLRASSGVLIHTTSLTFVPELRPLVAAGSVEAQFGFNAKSAKRVDGLRGFEDDLRKLSESDSVRLGVRGALYLKGRVQGKYLLTMRYDSQGNAQQLFRDIQPDEFYPVYGDSSVKGFDAQSSGRLYVRVDKNQSYVLYGDYVTNDLSNNDSLARYSRSLNGLQAHHETDKMSVTAFLSRDNTRRVVQELPARGISGPYRLANNSIVQGSEKVEIIVRDRNQPSVVISVAAQTRFTDYSIDGLTDGILFRRAIPSFDEDGNPVYIRVTYEVEQGGPNFTVSGINGQYKLSNNFQLGASLVHDANPEAPSDLRSLSAIYRLNNSTVLFGEWAHSDTNEGKGSAQRLELAHTSQKLQARLFYGRSEKGFNNPEALLSGGRSEMSARFAYRMNTSTRLTGEAIRTEDRSTGNTLTGAQLAVEKSLSETVRLQAGIRHAKSEGGPANPEQQGSGNLDFTSAFARVSAQVRPDVTLFGRYERSISGDSRQSFQLGGEYQFNPRSRVYAVHEFLSSFGSLYALNNNQRQYSTRFGIETDYMKNGSAFGEYRLNNGIDARSAQAAFGLRNLWQLSKGVRLQTSFERTQRLGKGPADIVNDDGTAASVGIEWLRGDNFRATARVEGRVGEASDRFLTTAGVAWKPSQDWTLLARQALAITKAEEERKQGRFQLGAAYRPTKNDKLNVLAKYEYRYDSGGDVGTGFGGGLFGGDDNSARKVHLFSLDTNYQASASTQLMLHMAWKKAQEKSDGIKSDASAYLVSGRITKDLNPRFDISLTGSILSGAGRQTGLGVEVGYLMSRNLWLSAGYNAFGFEDRDLAGDLWTRKGPYVRLRFKFDEDLLNGIEAFRKPGEVSDGSSAFKPVAQIGSPAPLTDEGPLSSTRAPKLGGANSAPIVAPTSPISTTNQ